MMLYIATLLAFLFAMLALGLVPVLRGRRLLPGCRGIPGDSSDCCLEKGNNDERSTTRS
jgi:hypothetical protein